MFTIKRVRLIENLKALKHLRCSYGQPYGGVCDCKYATEPSDITPNTFDEIGAACPEISNAIFLLERMTDEEYAEILKRKL